MVMEPNKDIIVKTSTITGRIDAIALDLLNEHKDGMQWSELIKAIKQSDPTLHPKTINGCIWKLIQQHPDKVYKPAKGLFRLLKYKTD